uniref:SPX domain-containing protein n=1 Tax=Chromera velia CCMP2878 TaxID=1169474 RepID=A0A0G4G503_9ALVE|eukprot:Cvel_20251.t1-p1 / transcript=Cvel_20251.t1 / gene=Cvel_20251 / organism=Chromera_velia_CCMP2878 / gene_product=Vacuolar transporter chaperone 4, putative / transcript_product=Vacuolar transporter chaperone 4, putative / location=Cvel_scaffold1805:28374-38404(-) / protein_length=823 / sequence_SO=supercontig / SO=protein_coding / is_pseudo=false
MEALLRDLMDVRYAKYYVDYRELKRLTAQCKSEAAKQYAGSAGPSFAGIVYPEALRKNPRSVLKETSDRYKAFEDQVVAEIQKMNKFATTKAINIEEKLKDVIGTMANKESIMPHELSLYKEDIEAQANEIVHLDAYIRINYRALVFACHDFDRSLQVSFSTWLLTSLPTEPFNKINQDRLLIGLHLAWTRWRAASEQGKDTTTWVPPSSFVRNTTKYWVKQHNIVKCKCLILRHMPYLIIGSTPEKLEKVFLEAQLPLHLDKRRKSESEKRQLEKKRKQRGMGGRQNSVDYARDMQRLAELESGEKRRKEEEEKISCESQLISSVYFDNQECHCYKERIKRMEGAPLLRLRWYGENDGSAEKEVFVEKKTHHEGWVGEDSVKERYVVKQEDVWSVISGETRTEALIEKYSAPGGGPNKKPLKDKDKDSMRYLGKQVEFLIHDKKVRPMVRTTYSRCAFQLGARNDVRFSLDTNLAILNELTSDGAPQEYLEQGRSPPQFWAKQPTTQLRWEDIVRFKYAVLEVKLQTTEPAWVSGMLELCEATAVHKFSKFQHGMAWIHRSLLDSSKAPYPHWWDELHEKKQYRCGFGGLGNVSIDLGREKDRPAAGPGPGAAGALQVGGDRPKAPPLARPKIEDMENARQRALAQAADPPQQLLQSLQGGPRGGKSRPLQAELAEVEALPQEELRRMIEARRRGMLRLEPKSFFAAERVFLHYVNHALYVGAMAIALYDLGPRWTRISGMIMAPVSIVLLVYSYIVFRTRSKAIKEFRPNSRFDHDTGPLVVFVVLALALLATIFVNLEEGTPFIVKKTKGYALKMKSHSE